MSLTIDESKEREDLLLKASSKNRWMSQDEQDRLKELNRKLFINQRL